MFKKTILRTKSISDRIIEKLLDFMAVLNKFFTGQYEEITAGEKLRIIFILSVDIEWDCFSRIYELFTKSPGVDVLVIADDYLRNNKEQLPSTFLAAIGVSYVQSANYSVRIHRPHVIFVADEISIRRNQWILRNKARIIYIPYGTSISAADYSKHLQYNLPLHNRAWKIFVAGDFAKEFYGLYCRKGNAHVIVLGHPKSEVMYEASKAYKYPTLPASQENPRIFLWNIHYRHGGPWNTWNEYGAYILNLFASRDDARLICRPHPFFFDAFSTTEESEKIRNLIVGNRNTILDETASMRNSFVLCDALLTDASSIIYDFGVTTKPILYLRTSRSEKLHRHAYEFVKKYHYIGDTEKKIKEFVDMVCDVGADRSREDRKRYILDGVGMPSPESINSHIFEYLKNELRAN